MALDKDPLCNHGSHNLSNFDIATNSCNEGNCNTPLYQYTFFNCTYMALFNIEIKEVARGVVQKMGIGSILSGHPI